MKRQIKKLVEARLPALGIAYRRLRDDWIYARTKPYESKIGLTIYGDTSRYFTAGDAISDRLDSHEIESFQAKLERADVFVDIGANIGIFTMLAARAGKPCIAIEPHPKNFQNLLRNLEANDIDGVECFNFALSDSAGFVNLFGSGEMASLNQEWGGKTAVQSMLVARTTLDRLIAHRFVGQRLLIKMDTEGHEYSVLQGAAEVLRQEPKPEWVFEHGFCQNFADVNPHYLDVLEAFWSAGYQVLPADIQAEVDPQEVREQAARKEDPFPGNLNFFAIGR
ncbi:FkbM family methyltransferase [Cerasicoccus frondis]|uniref:FkbM family methyltransferase n=1 Tax=Cerasicoccus frondis TaxID=490090 RepID=UPI002852C964|nr:FkbM family methyltransferase [Cerasicoccus frondis]